MDDQSKKTTQKNEDGVAQESKSKSKPKPVEKAPEKGLIAMRANHVPGKRTEATLCPNCKCMRYNPCTCTKQK